MKQRQEQEASVLDRLKDFKDRLNEKKQKVGQNHWMNTKLKFHVDSENAYNLQDTLEGVRTYGAGDVNQNLTQINTYKNAQESSVGSKLEVDEILRDLMGI